MWHYRRNQSKIEMANENGIVTKVDETATIQMEEVTIKKEVHQIISKLQTKVVTEVVLQIEEYKEERSSTKPMFNTTIVKSMIIMLMSVLQTRKATKKMM